MDSAIAGAEAPKSSTPTPVAGVAADSRLHRAIGLYLSAVWRVLRRAGLSSADCEDTSQDVFWIFAQKLDRIPEHAVRAFLLSTALKLAANRVRTRWHRSVTEPFDPESTAFEVVAAEDALDLRRARALLDAALLRLPAPERDIFIMVHLEQMSRSEVAEALGVPEGTVASRLKRGRKRFDAALRSLRPGRREVTHG